MTFRRAAFWLVAAIAVAWAIIHYGRAISAIATGA